MNAIPAVDQFGTILSRDGLPAAIEWLNAQVQHRYTGVYRLQGSKLYNVALFDKQGELRPDALAVVDLGDSFCQFVLRDGRFLADNTARMPMLDGHVFQGVVLGYHGVPVADDQGGLYGTLCHFDFAEQSLPDPQFELLQHAGRRLFPYVRNLGSDRA